MKHSPRTCTIDSDGSSSLDGLNGNIFISHNLMKAPV